MAKRGKMWIYNPPRPSKPQVPDAIKTDLEARANELVEGVLKPAHIRPPSPDERFNYIVDIYTKWYRNYFYFSAKYCCPGPTALLPFFEAKFARLEYIGNDRFNLSYMRHTGQWWEIDTDLSVHECLTAIKDEPHFLP
jgi:hypothetical protein